MLGVALVAAVAAAGAVAGVLLSGSGAARPAPLGGAVAPPARYLVVYRIQTGSSTPGRPGWEVLDVSDPFTVSDLTYTADPASGAPPQGGSVTTYDGLYDLAGGRLTLVTHRQPGLGSGAQALTTETADMLRRGVAERLPGRRVVAGLSCSTLRLSEPPAGPLTPLGPSGHDDLCLTDSGVDLAQTWTLGGKIVLQRTATEVRVGGSDARLAGPPPPAPPTPAADVLLAVSRPAEPGSMAPPPAPQGFTRLPSLHAVAHDPTDTSRVVDASDIWVFRRGGEVVSVEAGTGRTPWDDRGLPTEPAALPLGPAVSLLRSDGPEIQLQWPGSRWVRIRGTVPLTELRSYASELAPPAAG